MSNSSYQPTASAYVVFYIPVSRVVSTRFAPADQNPSVPHCTANPDFIGIPHVNRGDTPRLAQSSAGCVWKTSRWPFSKKLSQNRWHGRLARANVSQCERSTVMKRTGETPVPPEVGF